MNLHCPKCLTSRTGDELGAPCRTTGCDGVIARAPEFRELVDTLPEPMRCGRRDDPFGASHMFPGDDHWHRFKTNGQRVCSYCGSLHPDDFFALVARAADAADDDPEAVSIEPSDKRYKIYVRQPGVRNAHEGGIKFYTHHLPRGADGKIAVTPEQEEAYARAVAKSDERWRRLMRRS